MKIKFLIYIFIYLIFLPKSFANEIDFEAKDLKVLDGGNKIIAFKSKAKIKSKKLSIESQNAEYDKIKNTLNLQKKYFLSTKTIKSLLKVID